MRLHDQLIPRVGTGEACKIIESPLPPKKWVVQYTSGRTASKTKSFLKKYYQVQETK